MDLYRQTETLRSKTLKIIITRHFRSTLYSALVLPVIASVYLGLGQNFNQPNDKFGIGATRAISSLENALSNASGGRDTVVLINKASDDAATSKVIDSVSDIVTKAGKNATQLNSEDDIGYVCQSSIRGTSRCFGAVVIHSAGDQGWNYTIRADSGIGYSFDVTKSDNDAQRYALPLQKAVDDAITGSNRRIDEYPITSITNDEREAEVRRQYQGSFIKYLSVSFLIALIGVCYHMPGFIATERENGLSQLIDAMMPVKFGWHSQLARLVSHHNAFALTYLPGWIIASVVCQTTIWKLTNIGILIVGFILSGLAMTSMSLLGACFFKKAQLSGVITGVVWLILGIVAQVLNNPLTAAVIVLSLLFTPCNFVFFIIYIARYEREGKGANLAHAHDDGRWNVPGYLLWVFLAIQIFVYPLLAAFLERALHGVATGSRNSTESGDAVRIDNMTKIYQPSFLRRLFAIVSPPRPRVVAVDSLNLTAKKGQILALLGANGSGKSTTLDAIAGISNYTHGRIAVDASGGLGIAPQKNVLWDELTVFEHISIFNKLKSPNNPAPDSEIHQLIDAVGLREKTRSWAKTLSGGQKRKLQLGLMLTGGSAVCCVDEVSSGIDPLSRRKIWDILLRERGRRTIIMTTHFLDEADLLADKVAILSKGKLTAEGSSAQLKDTYGAGYRVHVVQRNAKNIPQVHGVHRDVGSNTVTYTAPSAGLAAQVIKELEQGGIPYKLSSPTIEDVFLNLAEEVKETEGDAETLTDPSKASMDLLQGRQVNMASQTLVFIRKRWTILKTNWIPYLAVFLIPIVAASIIQLLVKNESAAGCNPRDRSGETKNEDYEDLLNSFFVVAGPKQYPLANLTRDSFSAFKTAVEDNRSKLFPAGIWLGDSGSAPTVAYRANNYSSMYTSVFGQSLLASVLYNTSISGHYEPFGSGIPPNTGQGLQVIVYFSVACSIIPGLLGLYPNLERRRSIRALQYSSGARALPVWAGHFLFDFAIIVVSMAIAVGIFAAASDVWYHVGYLFPVFVFYASASMLISYFLSLFCASSISTYAMSAVVSALGFAIYLISFLFILTYSDPASTDKNILISNWVVSIFFPTGSLVRALMVALNVFAATCDGFELESNPGKITAYGGPILYLVLQCVIWFSLVVWFDSSDGKFQRGKPTHEAASDDPEVAAESEKIDQEAGGLRVAHLTKAFNKVTAVDNVSFGVTHGQVFALLGPNGAGKSTTISLIRGDIAPSKRGGDVFIENQSITKHRPLARANLGVCPQFDAIDNMTVDEHLCHYARLRGISDVPRQVTAVIQAVGLQPYKHVMAHTLSGGNKRKLSLAIALTGNPSVILLDEPSSGLDAAAKRVMWRTLQSIVPGRSILLTTHSMEEADALASRAGIMARRMLALGTTEDLCQRFGDTLHVHLVSTTAPHSTPAEMQRIQDWIQDRFPGAEIEQETFHGQMRFSVPAESVPVTTHQSSTTSPIGRLLVILEEHKAELGIAHHSVSPTTLNEVFLSIVGRHDVREEGEGKDDRPWYKKHIWELISEARRNKQRESEAVVTEVETDKGVVDTDNKAARTETKKSSP